MTDRFTPHPKHPGFLIGKTYKIRDYKEPEEHKIQEKTRKRIEQILKAQE